MGLAYTIAQAACGRCHDWYEPDYYAVSPIRNPTGVETGGARVLRGGLGTTSASKSVLRIGIGSALSLIRRILGSVECGINLSRRFLPQCRQIVPIAFKAEVILPTDSLDLLTTFWTLC